MGLKAFCTVNRAEVCGSVVSQFMWQHWVTGYCQAVSTICPGHHQMGTVQLPALYVRHITRWVLSSCQHCMSDTSPDGYCQAASTICPAHHQMGTVKLPALYVRHITRWEPRVLSSCQHYMSGISPDGNHGYCKLPALYVRHITRWEPRVLSSCQHYMSGTSPDGNHGYCQAASTICPAHHQMGTTGTVQLPALYVRHITR
jgi:hypothetical protein